MATKITASVDNFHDFYFMNAIMTQMGMAKSQNPELQFKRSFEKLESDVQEYYAEFCELYAENIMNYLWAACMGEARHASDMCYEGIILKGLDGTDRSYVYNQAHKYAINRENMDTMIAIYTQSWRDGYGGESWLSIVEAMDMFLTGQFDAVSFIDHCIDLQHNGGSAFNKYAKSSTGFSSDGVNDIDDFLDYKFKHDILTSHTYEVYRVSPKVRKLISRYNVVVLNGSVDDTSWARGTGNNVEKSFVVYGDKTIETEEINQRTCDRCDDSCQTTTTTKSGYEVCNDCLSSYYTECDHCGEYEKDYKITEIDHDKFCETCADEVDHEFCEDCEENVTEYVKSESGNFYCTDCSSNLSHCDEHDTYCESGENCPECENEKDEELTKTVALYYENEVDSTPKPLPHPTKQPDCAIFHTGNDNKDVDASQIYYEKGGLILINTGNLPRWKGETHWSVTHKLSGRLVLMSCNLLSGIEAIDELSGTMDFSYPHGNPYYQSHNDVLKKASEKYG